MSATPHFWVRLFPGPVLDKAWPDRCADLARAIDRLDAMSSQDALILLRSQAPEGF